MTRLFFLAALISATLVPFRLCADEPADKGFEVETKTDVAYRSDKDADPVKHKLDIYTPKGQKDFPVLMFVHGGAWKSGNKELYAALGKTFAVPDQILIAFVAKFSACMNSDTATACFPNS